MTFYVIRKRLISYMMKEISISDILSVISKNLPTQTHELMVIEIHLYTQFRGENMMIK